MSLVEQKLWVLFNTLGTILQEILVGSSINKRIFSRYFCWRQHFYVRYNFKVLFLISFFHIIKNTCNKFFKYFFSRTKVMELSMLRKKGLFFFFLVCNIHIPTSIIFLGNQTSNYAVTSDNSFKLPAYLSYSKPTLLDYTWTLFLSLWLLLPGFWTKWKRLLIGCV